MRDLLNCRRGSAAFATVIAMVPLIGAVALGAEAGTWYVTRQHAQNAADAAAYSGALRLACTISGGSCDTTQSVDYRGKQFAAQNAFCASGDVTAYPGRICATSLPTGISQAVQIEIGDYNGAFTTPPASTGNAVRATVSQTQPGYLAALLNFTTVTIPARATALVFKPADLCALALGPAGPGGAGAFKLAGNMSNNGTGCAMMSDTNIQFASTPTFTGSGWAVLGATGCSPTNTCADPGVTHNYFMPPALDPLQDLKTASFNSTTGSTSPCSPSGNVTNGNTCNLSPLSTAYGGLSVNSGGTLNLAAGTYFFYNANINFNGGTVTGTGVTLVLLGSSSLSINGGTIDLSAPSGPRSPTSPLNGVLIDDQATGNVNINGNGTVKLTGAMYFPKADVSFGGTVQPTNATCSEVIAKTLNMSGGAYLSTAGCDPLVVAHTQLIALVE
jgi:Flp pilus assembly protein TadG